jgi:hypothetical protein
MRAGRLTAAVRIDLPTVGCSLGKVPAYLLVATNPDPSQNLSYRFDGRRRFLAPLSGSACPIEHLIYILLVRRSLEQPGQLVRGLVAGPANDYPHEAQKPLHPDPKCHF